MKPPKKLTVIDNPENDKKSSQVFAFLPENDLQLFLKAKSRIREELSHLGHISANENISQTKVIKVLINTYCQLMDESLIVIRLNPNNNEQFKSFAKSEYIDIDKLMIKATEHFINNQKKEKKIA